MSDIPHPLGLSWVEEVEYLRKKIDYIKSVGRMDMEPSGYLLSIMEKVLTTQEYLKWKNEIRKWRNKE